MDTSTKDEGKVLESMRQALNAMHSEINRMDKVAQETELGPTGQIPEGWLVPEDEGRIKVAITSLDGKVVVNFGKPVARIGFTPDQAEKVADSLRQHAIKQRSLTPHQ